MQMILFLIYINFEIYNDLSDDPSGFFLDYTSGLERLLQIK
jgi:hypothetical protein